MFQLKKSFPEKIVFAAVVLILHTLILSFAQSLEKSTALWIALTLPNLLLFTSAGYLLWRYSINPENVRFRRLFGSLSILMLLIMLFVVYISEGRNSLSSLFSISYTAVVIFLVPFAEELFFRGFLLRTVQSEFGKIVAVLAVSLLFGFLHYSQGHFLIMAIFSVALSLITILSNRVIWAITLHLLWNGAAEIRTIEKGLISATFTIITVSLALTLIFLGVRKNAK